MATSVAKAATPIGVGEGERPQSARVHVLVLGV
jgi:hypothetical protein